MKSLTAIAAGLIVLGVSAEAAERLSAEGVVLPAATFAEGAPLEMAVDPGDDEVLSVHTLLRPASSNVVMMRDRDGFWSEWDGDRDSLVPSAARESGGVLVYKIFHSPPAGVNGMMVTVAYRTPDGLKFGWFQAARAGEGSN